MSEAKRQPSRLNIALSRCGGHARCLEEVPSVFGYDDRTNKAYVLDGAELNANRAAIDRAILACPELAISWAAEDAE